MTEPSPVESPGSGWYTSSITVGEDTEIIHIMPAHDIIDHCYDDCVCGVESEIWSKDDFEKIIMITSHNSLDGRELEEDTYEP